MHTPMRLTLPGDEKARQNVLMQNPKLKAAVAGKEFVPVKAEDIGVEAVDKYTVRISLTNKRRSSWLTGAPGFPARAAQSGGAVRR
jgi:ABC-type oligopeptide transport system substrate-binding subunit